MQHVSEVGERDSCDPGRRIMSVSVSHSHVARDPFSVVRMSRSSSTHPHLFVSHVSYVSTSRLRCPGGVSRDLSLVADRPWLSAQQLLGGRGTWRPVNHARGPTAGPVSDIFRSSAVSYFGACAATASAEVESILTCRSGAAPTSGARLQCDDLPSVRLSVRLS